MPDRSAHLFVRRACVCLASLGVLPLLGLFAAPAPVAAQVVEHHAATSSVVIEWNRVLNEAFAVPGAHPATIFFPRPYAMVNVAMFDAINSIELRYQPYSRAGGRRGGRVGGRGRGAGRARCPRRADAEPASAIRFGSGDQSRSRAAGSRGGWRRRRCGGRAGHPRSAAERWLDPDATRVRAAQHAGLLATDAAQQPHRGDHAVPGRDVLRARRIAAVRPRGAAGADEPAVRDRLQPGEVTRQRQQHDADRRADDDRQAGRRRRHHDDTESGCGTSSWPTSRAAANCPASTPHARSPC